MTGSIAEAIRCAASVAEFESAINVEEENRLIEFANGMTEGVELIAAERKRQIEEEGFGVERDDAYVDGEMLRVAVCYDGSACGFEVTEV